MPTNKEHSELKHTLHRQTNDAQQAHEAMQVTTARRLSLMLTTDNEET